MKAWRVLLFWTVICISCPILKAAGDEESKEVVVTPERSVWGVSFETAQLFGLSNPNNYYILPQILSFSVEPFSPLKIGSVPLRFQGMISFLGEPFAHGPETGYLGGALRWRLIVPLGDSTWSFYMDGGAGMGGADSGRTRYSLGQDFTFVLLASGGVRVEVTRNLSLSLGFMWQHLSNAGLSEPHHRNTAIDAIGPVLGAAWSF